MATYSTNLGLTLLATGEGAGTWGNTTNTNLGTLLEQAISGYVTQSVTTGATATITIPNGTTGVARNMYIELTGTGGAGTALVVPSNKKLYFIYNNSSGAVTVKVSGQTGISVPAATKKILVSDGTDIVEATSYVTSPVASLVVTNLTATSATVTTLAATSAVISGNLGVGGTPNAYDKVLITGNMPADGGTSYAIDSQVTFTSSANLVNAVNRTLAAVENASFTMSEMHHYMAQQGTKGALATVTSQYGHSSLSSLTGATNNYAFHGGIAAASGRWNFYASGTARNYFAGGVEVVAGTTGMSSGFTHIPAAAGAPTGAPTNPTGNVPMYYDSTNHKIYVYSGGTWRSTAALT